MEVRHVDVRRAVQHEQRTLEPIDVPKVLATAAHAEPSLTRLVTRVMGLTFPSPIGLAAGFDKNALRAKATAGAGAGPAGGAA